MPVARFAMPDGKVGRFEVPEGTTPEQATKLIGEHLATLDPKKEPGLMESLGRQVGLTARAAVQGTANLLALPGAIYDKAVDVYDNMRSPRIGELVTGKQPSFKFNSAQAVDRALTKTGLPEATTPQERVSQDVVGAMVPAAGQTKLAELAAKGGTGLTRLLAEKFAEGPGLQVASAATAGGAGGTAREMGAGPGGQMLATLAGGTVPAATIGGGSVALRSLARGGEEGRLKTLQNIRTFEDAGTTPTVGQATESRAARLAETMLGKTPGSAGIMANKAAQEAKDIGGKVGELADSLTLRSGSAPAGRAIKQGIEGESGFIEKFKAKQGELYDKLDKYIPPDTQVPATNVLTKAAELRRPIAGAKETSALLQTPKVGAIGEALAKDAGAKPSQQILSSLLGPDGKPIVTGQTAAQPGGMPYQALKELRTAIGAKITNPSLTDDVSTGQWKQLYGALSQDLEGAARSAGPEAEKAFAQANAYTKAGHSRIENVLQPVLKKADPEDIFRAATSGMQEGATTIQGVMKSLPDSAQRSVAATVLNRMGTAGAGKQNATGEIFSPDTFLTNWNKMTPDAKTALFSRYGLNYTQNLDQIAKVTANLREGNKIFANPSGTEAAMTSKLGVAGIIYGVLFGHPAAAGTLAGGMVGAHVGAKYLMTNPAFVGWLAQTSKMPAGALAAQASTLERLADKQSGDAAQEMRDFAAKLRTLQ